ncbi:ABC transporter substrate-binding protein [Sediminibacillus albus]|uniref:Multiple sugar transport system substrate-binding protein n=1 Tax=Sediminibacillus albus TaxID=407036 RepID=A0A1G8YDV5_9BACI|nr:extracellular solute-binding protein [Sediminibacillus albus]SDK00847.1 multiple sugar transport system substrate-binding protein [Sediminibacillus albus]
MKKSVLMLLGMLMVLWLAACSNSEETSGETGESSGDGEITLRMAWWGDQPRNDYTTKVIEMYEEQNPNVKIEAEYANWDDYWQKLSPQAAANELPDIIQMDVSYLAQYAQSNQLADLEPFLGEQIDVSNMTEDYVDGGKIEDGIYGMNLGVNAVGFHYNPALLEEIGADSSALEAWTWDDYKSLADQAAEKGIYFDTAMKADVFFNYYLRTQGKRLYAEDGSGLGYEDDQLFIDFFSMMAEQVEKGATPTPDVISQVTGIEDDPVVKGEAVGIWQWSNQFVGLQQVADAPLEISPMPGPNASDGLYLKPSMFFSIAKNSEHKQAAAEFLDFFVNNVEANKLILGDRGVPGSSEVKDALKSEISEAQQQVFEYIEWAEQNSSPMGAPDPAGAGEVIELLDTLAEQISYGQVTPEDAASNFRNQAESMLAQ